MVECLSVVEIHPTVWTSQLQICPIWVTSRTWASPGCLGVSSRSLTLCSRAKKPSYFCQISKSSKLVASLSTLKMVATWEKSSSWKIRRLPDSHTSTFLSSIASSFLCQAQLAAFTSTILSLRRFRLLNSQSTALASLASQKPSKSFNGGRCHKRAMSIGPWNTKGLKGYHLIGSSSKSPPRLLARSA